MDKLKIIQKTEWLDNSSNKRVGVMPCLAIYPTRIATYKYRNKKGETEFITMAQMCRVNNVKKCEKKADKNPKMIDPFPEHIAHTYAEAMSHFNGILNAFKEIPICPSGWKTIKIIKL